LNATYFPPFSDKVLPATNSDCLTTPSKAAIFNTVVSGMLNGSQRLDALSLTLGFVMVSCLQGIRFSFAYSYLLRLQLATNEQICNVWHTSLLTSHIGFEMINKPRDLSLFQGSSNTLCILQLYLSIWLNILKHLSEISVKNQVVTSYI